MSVEGLCVLLSGADVLALVAFMYEKIPLKIPKLEGNVVQDWDRALLAETWR